MDEEGQKGQSLPEVPLASANDLHGLEHMEEADLVLFMAGNQFMAMDELISAFRKLHPDIENIYYETLPPGLELRQIIAQGARFGTMTLTGRPDVYTSVSEDAMDELSKRTLIDEHSAYLHNRLVLMVPEGNPKNIIGVQDLARPDIRVSQPGAMEDITEHIKTMYIKAGGERFLIRVMEEKRAEGTTLVTRVHHRETPLRLHKGTVDAGPVWATEVEHARREGLPVEAVEPGPGLDMRNNVNYYIAELSDAPNPENAERFVKFILSQEAQGIFESYGFVPHKV